MPPKKEASKKTVEKAKQKIIEDKTFGLKNKNKSKKVQQYVESVKKTVNQAHGGQQKKEQALAEQKRREKEAAEQARKEMEQLFKPVVQQQKVPIGVDPKSILCEYFKIGTCTKGDRCKFSHDLNIGRKAEKIDLYTDRRNAPEEEDTIDTWDQTKLETVVSQKQTSENKNLKTKIVCKYFLDAIEQRKYGWFWECPNGGDRCIYQHCLPPGYVFQAKKKVVEEDEEEPIPIEEQIEEERLQLTTRTPVTLETFMRWKEEKRIRKERERKEAEERRVAEIRAGRTLMSGREAFLYNPDIFVDDDAAIDVTELGPDEDGTPDESAPDQQDNFPDGYDAGADPEQENGDDDGGEGSSSSRAADQLAVDVQENLFMDDGDIPDEDEDEDEEDGGATEEGAGSEGPAVD